MMEGRDTLALLPTGGGKSVCFQVPAMAKNGCCLVISPLIALMKDQEEQLREKGIRAVAIVSGMRKSEVETAIANCIHGQYKFLYLSPERLSSDSFRSSLKDIPVNLIAVDEAHCISQWGYDFRPPYRRIAEIREFFPQVPVLALTASATPEVREDICKQLEFKNSKTYSKSFARSNLSYLVRYAENKEEHLLRILKNVAGTSIIYVRNRRRTQEIASWLLKQGIKADYYHAGLDHQTRSLRQSAWMQNKTRVMVSTNAFGMGINKPDVRSVIHLDLPDDLESYYQEAGRGGRDEKPAYAVVLFDHADISDLERRSVLQFPERVEIRRVYKAVCNYLNIPFDSGSAISYDFDLVDFCRHYQLEPRITFNCLKMLEMCEYISLSEAFYLPARLKITTGNMAVYDFQVRNPKYEGLIKAILRSFSGVFDDYVRVSETELARKSGLERKELDLQLDYLKQLELLDYIPASDRPRLALTQPRIDEKDLYLPRTLLEDRKSRFMARMSAFRNFITHPTSCRAMMLLSYFGEGNLQRCGTCDTCRERNKVPLNDLRIEEVRHKILEALGNGPLEADELFQSASGMHRNDLQSVMRWMLDAGELGTDAMARIYIKEG